MRNGRTLMIVVAHPDDDAYGMSGSIALHSHEPGFRFVLVHATDGGQGDLAPGFAATRDSNSRTARREECRAAWRAQGRVPDRHEWLELEDGRVADEAFHRCREQGLPGMRRLLHGALPQSVFERWNAQRVASGARPWNPAEVYQLRGVPDDELDVTVDCSSVAHRMVAGLREHRSQLHVITDNSHDLARWARRVSREHYVQAWPPRELGRARLGDVFEGLDDPEEPAHRVGASGGR